MKTGRITWKKELQKGCRKVMEKAEKCPFCGEVPVFSGFPEPRNDNRYFVYPLPCTCHAIEVKAMGWHEWSKHVGHLRTPPPSLVEAAIKGAIKNWNASFLDNR